MGFLFSWKLDYSNFIYIRLRRMIKIPEFLFIPKARASSNDALAFFRKYNICWQVFEFANEEEKFNWFNENQLKPCKVHKKYLFGFLLLDIGTATPEKALAITNRALKWYAEFYFKRNPKIPIIDKADLVQKFYYWFIGANNLRDDEIHYLVNTEDGVLIRFNYVDAYGVSFEDFKNKVVDVQFLSGRRPSENKVNQILVEAWNYLTHEENLLDETDFDIF